MTADLKFVDESSPEWEKMWQALGEDPLNKDLPDPTVCMEAGWGECWQYMGTERHGRKWLHCFRHRCHPTTGERTYIRIPQGVK